MTSGASPSNRQYDSVVLFGGSGFIGTHFAEHLVRQKLARRVVLADIRPPARSLGAASDAASYVHLDVRKPIDPSALSCKPDLIVNLAAVHREPGHEPPEYFETNIAGAENVCAYADQVSCNDLVFTSSISVYGPTEEEKTERSPEVPMTPYGSSKLVAEHIHRGWHRAAQDRRKLVIVRPGVVFGPGENGNVSRLVKSVVRRYFLYCRNRNVRKAGGYVKELCHTLEWALGVAERQRSVPFTYNFTLDPTPRLEELVNAVAGVAGVARPVLSIPYRPMLAASHVANAVGRVANIRQPLHPMRVRKLVHSNNISAGVLRERGYRPVYSLDSALVDWKQSQPDEWK